MQTVGKFILLNVLEFKNYLETKTFTRVIKLVQNHHTYIPNYSYFKNNNHFSLLRGMENSHIERGFSEIAQNLTTFPDGTVAICRDINTIPAGIKGANSNGICIEHLGNFDTGGDQMNQQHTDTIIKTNVLFCKKFNLAPNTDTIVYHHWYDLTTGQRTNGMGNTKSCPGTNFFGGNTVANAQSSFIPLVQKELNAYIMPPASIVSNAHLQHGIVNADVLNVREGAGKQYKVVKTIKRGTTVAIYQTMNGWYQIDNGNFWVNSSFIELV